MTIEKKFKILNFNKQTGSILIQFDRGESFWVDIPVKEDGNYMVGDELIKYVNGMYPQIHYDRLDKISNGIKNSDEIEKLIEKQNIDNVNIDQYPEVFLEVQYEQTPDEVINKMIDISNINENDVVFDLGAGDGHIAISAAKHSKNVIAIEKNPYRINAIQTNMRNEGVNFEIKIQSLLDTDLSSADIIFTFLTEQIMAYLGYYWLPKLKKGTKIVAYWWPISWVKPDHIELVKGIPIYLYIVK